MKEYNERYKYKKINKYILNIDGVDITFKTKKLALKMASIIYKYDKTIKFFEEYRLYDITPGLDINPLIDNKRIDRTNLIKFKYYCKC